MQPVGKRRQERAGWGAAVPARVGAGFVALRGAAAGGWHVRTLTQAVEGLRSGCGSRAAAWASSPEQRRCLQRAASQALVMN